MIMNVSFLVVNKITHNEVVSLNLNEGVKFNHNTYMLS